MPTEAQSSAPTSRAALEQALRESEVGFGSMFEQPCIGMALVAVDGRWLRVNDRLCVMLGYPRGELLERDFLSVTHPDDLRDNAGTLERCVAAGGREYKRQTRYVRKDGSSIWVSVSASLVRDSAGEPLYFGALIEDITQQRLSDAQLELVKTSVDLPRHAGAVEPARTPEPRAREASGETVLVVEDERLILRLITTVLGGLGYATLGTASPGEAMRLAREHTGQIHLLLTDVIMPEMNGRELAKRVLALHPGAKVLFMSGYTADIIARDGVVEPGISFLQKPFTLDGLTAKVREALDQEPR